MMPETMADQLQRMDYANLGDFVLGLYHIDPNIKFKETDDGVTILFSDGSSYRAHRGTDKKNG